VNVGPREQNLLEIGSEKSVTSTVRQGGTERSMKRNGGKWRREREERDNETKEAHPRGGLQPPLASPFLPVENKD